jgi:hypothetical protein
MKRRILFVSLSLMICASYAQIYKWTDSQGVVHFSDSPHPGSQTVDNPEVQSFSSPVPSKPDPSSEENSVPENKVHQYRSIAVVQPAEHDTIRNTEGYIPVKVTVDPKLHEGDSVQMVFDGAGQGAPQRELSFQLKGVNRGSHTIAAHILDAQGAVLKTSPAITVYMQQPRVGMGHAGKH